MEVNIYVDIYHTGNLKTGKGQYGLIVEYIKDGRPITREYLEGWLGTTKNRTAYRGYIKALEYLIKPCKVKFYTNMQQIVDFINKGSFDMWITTGTNAKGKPVKNLDLCKQLDEIMKKHEIEFIYTDNHSYSSYIATQIKLMDSKMRYKEDENNV